MAFYTTPSLPRTPSACNMNATLPSLPSELLNWSMWRYPKQDAPLTPPMTSTFQRRRPDPVRTTLPPISFLDRAMAPLTPPQEVHQPSTTRLPPIHDYHPCDTSYAKPATPLDVPQVVDWFDVSQTRSAHFIAEKTCEMICYLWFSTSPSTPSASSHSPNNSPPFLHRPNTATTTQQLVASPTFIQFMQKLLETTQVSQSVIVLSLHYIQRLKEGNGVTAAQPGSEFRIAVAALMMANKFLDDNTYTNKTWSEVSGIELSEINKMEKEFLKGVRFNLYVDKATYETWTNLLKGLVMAKERDCRQWRKSRGLGHSPRRAHPHSSAASTSRTYTSRYRSSTHRARSTSPGQTTRSYASDIYSPNYLTPPTVDTSYCSPSPASRSGSKRSAEAAFSPTSATFTRVPAKRPVISLYIPELASAAGPKSHSPLDGLQSFSKMSLASSAASSPMARLPPPQAENQWSSTAKPHPPPPETLVTAYRVEEGQRPTPTVPEKVYFLKLTCSPMENEEESQWRKARLRYHQPPPPMPASYYPSQPPMPLNVQSASASPHDVHMTIPHHPLPRFHDFAWSRQRPPLAPNYAPSAPPPPYHEIDSTPPPQQQQQHYQHYRTHSQEFSDSPIPSAPFANAGPPGVQFYPTPVVHRSSPVYPHNWSRGRQL